MSFHASNTAQRLDHGLWRALTRLDGFEFPPEPVLTGDQLKRFGKAIIGKSSWRHLTQRELAVRVTVVFEAACSIYESDNDPASNDSFYVRVAKKASKTKSKDRDIFRQIIGTYVDGLKRAATRSQNQIYVDRRCAPAALSVASWIEITEGTIISITTKKPTDCGEGTARQQASGKRRAGDLGDDCDGRTMELQKAIADRDKACQELEQAKEQIGKLARHIETAKHKCDTQAARTRDAELEIGSFHAELRRMKAKQERYLKAIKTVQQDRNEMIANIKRRYDDHASQYFARVEADWKNATGQLTNIKQERDQLQRTMADCAEISRFLNSKLTGGTRAV
ncbi:hypothetical protein NUW58_g1359 [Xylaria curta]|uniref:Uncharacterized protein n=1 Tax=Xylaria curta TaxID=42375 RepID=A0ACC1PML8_9PEZI|nr:hypothetical protein NUW58_g1359 [Xylaria curta]